MPDDELQHFKAAINLSEFAASRGYVLDRRESSRNSAVMRRPDGDKIIIARNEASGDWMYFSVRDDRDNGTIIDFLQRRDGGSLGQVRKILRPWLGSARPVVPVESYVQTLFPISRDRAAVIAAWSNAQVCVSLPYLTNRGIGPDILALPQFKGCVWVDHRRNALFPHYDKEGLCGFEIKNRNFTGFATGGIKGLWYSNPKKTDRQLVLAESGIDAISYHVLHPDELWTRYMSTGGELSPEQRGRPELEQPGLLRLAMEKLPVGAVVLLAFDNDEPGDRLEKKVRALAPPGREVRRVKPEKAGDDWNKVLTDRLGLT